MGVNRLRSGSSSKSADFPHARGGEPDYGDNEDVVAKIFPTHVGVNRLGSGGRALNHIFPTHVGVNCGCCMCARSRSSISHARGG